VESEQTEEQAVPTYNFEKMLEMALKSQDPSANQSTGNRPLARKDPEEEKELTES
jgi:hypothetical protein